MMSMSHDAAQQTIHELNTLREKFVLSNSDNMKAKHANAMDKLEELLTRGNRSWVGGWVHQDDSLMESGRTYEVYKLVLTPDEIEQREAMMKQYKHEAMAEALNDAKKEYRAKLKDRIEMLQRELARIDSDQLDTSTYRYSGEMDLPILNERIIYLTKLVRYADTGDFNRW